TREGDGVTSGVEDAGASSEREPPQSTAPSNPTSEADATNPDNTDVVDSSAGSWSADPQCLSECLESGLCAFGSDTENVGGAATRSEHCEASRGCRLEGRCSVRDGACVVASDADCAAATACVDDGACAKVGDACLPATDADCRNASQCKWSALCYLEGN